MNKADPQGCNLCSDTDQIIHEGGLVTPCHCFCHSGEIEPGDIVRTPTYSYQKVKSFGHHPDDLSLLFESGGCVWADQCVKVTINGMEDVISEIENLVFQMGFMTLTSVIPIYTQLALHAGLEVGELDEELCSASKLKVVKYTSSHMPEQIKTLLVHSDRKK